jgi:hypothetical protein
MLPPVSFTVPPTSSPNRSNSPKVTVSAGDVPASVSVPSTSSTAPGLFSVTVLAV